MERFRYTSYILYRMFTTTIILENIANLKYPYRVLGKILKINKKSFIENKSTWQPSLSSI